jgi:mRNA interferase MazF
MVTPSVGAVILVPFPFSDLSRTKLRPAVVLADVGKSDWILCQITSNPYGDSKAITLTNNSFTQGSLQVTSYARPGKLFTSNSSLMVRQVGSLKSEILKITIGTVIDIFRSGLEH